VIAAFALTFLGALGKWLIFRPGNDFWVPFDALLCGPVWIAINILTPAMLADICDEDELRGGMRREGTFGAIFSAEGFPALKDAGNVLRPYTAFKLSLRLPPLVDGNAAALELKALLARACKRAGDAGRRAGCCRRDRRARARGHRGRLRQADARLR
jgi:hypothetical protein